MEKYSTMTFLKAILRNVAASAINGATKRVVVGQFVPNYNNGTEPDGVFIGATAYTLPDWLAYGGTTSWKGNNSDVAFDRMELAII